ncbi:MAG TPA: hypothetical protein DCQ93_06620 [Bacteroidetes bacterium]|nr:hypothetical protein [Bacteroidota bacterium]
MENSVVIPPCFVGENVHMKNSVVGPYVSVGKNSVIEDCRIENSIIQNDSLIKYKVIGNSMIGSNAILAGKPGDVSLGDYSAEA